MMEESEKHTEQAVTKTEPSLKGLLNQMLYAAVLILAHAVLALFLIFCVYGIERAFNYLYNGEPLLFGRLPIDYIFDFSNFAILIMFVFQTFVSTMNSIRRWQKG